MSGRAGALCSRAVLLAAGQPAAYPALVLNLLLERGTGFALGCSTESFHRERCAHWSEFAALSCAPSGRYPSPAAQFLVSQVWHLWSSFLVASM